MENNMRRCKQCGEHKNMTTEYREYYNRKGGRYRTCKSCERINNRYKYLLNKEARTEHEDTEMEKIEKLYELLRQRGLRPPEVGSKNAVLDDVEALLEKQEREIEEVVNLDAPADTPNELQMWLRADLQTYDEDQIEEIEEQLIQKFRPQVGVDPESYAPIFDETHRVALNKVLKRLDEYVDTLEE